jgi:hypothetical protein
MRAAPLLMLVVTCEIGCGVGSGTGALSGTLWVSPCTSDADYGTSATAPNSYDMQPTFFVASPIDDFRRPHPVNRLSLRVQPQGNRVEEADALILVVANDLPVAQTVGQETDVGAATNVRATLALNARCPEAGVQMELDGKLTWTAFGKATAGGAVAEDFKIDFDDRLAATFSFEVVDRRALTLGGVGGVPVEPSASGHLDGNFDFIVRQGRAAQSP